MAIAGGGIVGLSAALELARAGLKVTVFERGRAMGEASGAAAGMLAASDPENPAQLSGLAKLSAELYPQFLADVERFSGVPVPIRTRHTIHGTRRVPEGLREMDAAELEAVAPGMVANGLRFCSLDEWSLDPRDLARALPGAVRAADVSLLENIEVTQLTERSGTVEIETSGGQWTAERFIHASGAWAARLAGVPIAPRKGQMTMVEEQGTARLAVVLRTPEIYLVPRGDGRIVIGATVEDAGFDKQANRGAINNLLHRAAELWPRAREFRVVDAWAGLRPATPDGLPVIDACSEHCWIAGGHFRNGILLAPGTARLLREMILGEPPSAEAAEFRCGRFAAASCLP